MSDTKLDSINEGIASLREAILGSNDIETELLCVPQWGVTVKMKGMDGLTRSRCLTETIDATTGKVDSNLLYPMVIIACALDPKDDTPIFTEADAGAINTKSGAALEAVATVGMRLSGLSDDAQAEAGKGSSATPSAPTTSS